MAIGISLPRFVVVECLLLYCADKQILLISATNVTLVQGHGNVIQYIFLTYTFSHPKYLRLSINGDSKKDGGGNETKTESHTRLGWVDKSS